MNISNLNEISTTSESDSEYLVDSRYCRTTVKCKRKALKKTIKLIHGRCVVIYRGSGDLLPIAAKDADQNCYCDFVFICHDPRPIKQVKETSAISRSRSAIHDSSISDDDNENNNNAFQKRLSKQNSFSFKTKINDNTNSSITIEKESLIKNNYTNKKFNEQIDVDIDELINADEPSSSIVYTRSMSNIVVDTNQ